MNKYGQPLTLKNVVKIQNLYDVFSWSIIQLRVNESRGISIRKTTCESCK